MRLYFLSHLPHYSSLCRHQRCDVDVYMIEEMINGIPVPLSIL